MVLSEVSVDIVAAEDEARFRDLMQTHHYLGAVPGMGETVRYVAHHRGRWLALAVFSAPALKCGARDRWIGWDRSLQFGRLHLVTNNARFLILPGGGRNLGSRVLSLCARRVVRDWPARFGHDVLLAETFVDPARFHGTVYRAANWIEVGRTRGFARGGAGYSEHASPKLVFLLPLSRTARARLRAADLDPRLRHGVPKMTLSAAQMRSLPEFFQNIDDPRRRQGRRHALPTVLALASAATLCGMRGYKAISEWVDDLSPRVLQRFRVRRRDGQYRPPSLSAMRSLLIRVDPAQLDAALRAWHEAHGSGDSALAIDGKTIRGAIDADGTPDPCARHRRPRLQGTLGGKKSRHEARRRRWREAHQRDRHRHPPARDAVPDIAGRTVTADALLTQRALASYLLGRGADYPFTVKSLPPRRRGATSRHC